MVDSTSYAALDLAWDTLDATIVLGVQRAPSCAQHPRIPWNQPSRIRA
jgi:hypothetical protein